jgi:hypothetical protein
VKLFAYEYANENSGSVKLREQVNLAEFISLSSKIVMFVVCAEVNFLLSLNVLLAIMVTRC